MAKPQKKVSYFICKSNMTNNSNARWSTALDCRLCGMDKGGDYQEIWYDRNRGLNYTFVTRCKNCSRLMIILVELYSLVSFNFKRI